MNGLSIGQRVTGRVIGEHPTSVTIELEGGQRVSVYSSCGTSIYGELGEDVRRREDITAEIKDLGDEERYPYGYLVI